MWCPVVPTVVPLARALRISVRKDWGGGGTTSGTGIL